jgi:hypothetical protein
MSSPSVDVAEDLVEQIAERARAFHVSLEGRERAWETPVSAPRLVSLDSRHHARSAGR